MGGTSKMRGLVGDWASVRTGLVVGAGRIGGGALTLGAGAVLAVGVLNWQRWGRRGTL